MESPLWASAIAPSSPGVVAGSANRREVGFALRAGLGEASAARENGDQRAAVGDLVDLLLAAAGGAGPRRQAVDHVRRGGDGRHARCDSRHDSR